ncbi:MAG TPA: cell division protein ZapA [Spirochaetota bacterium]
MTNKVRVSIFGNTYTIQGDASPEYIDSLSRYINAKMDEVSGSMPSASAVQVAILAALNIADEYFQLRDIQSSVTTDIEKKTDMLISMLEDGIIGDIFQKTKGDVTLPRSGS